MKHSILFAIMAVAVFTTGTRAQSIETAQYFDLGIRSLERSQPEKAFEYFDRSLRSAERSHTSPQFRAKIHYNIGVSLYRLNRFADAAEQYDKAVKLSEGRYKKASHALSAAREKIDSRERRTTEIRAEARQR